MTKRTEHTPGPQDEFDLDRRRDFALPNRVRNLRRVLEAAEAVLRSAEEEHECPECGCNQNPGPAFVPRCVSWCSYSTLRATIRKARGDGEG